MIVVLAACIGVSNTADPAVVIWSYRVVASLLYVGTGILLLRTLKARGVHRTFQYLFVVLFLFESKTTIFSSNGMETPAFLFFLALLIYLLISNPTPNVYKLALCYAALVFTRPDGALYGLILFVAYFVFLNRDRRTVELLAKVAFLAFLLYLPWFVFSWWYFGNPVPHTVVAKSIEPHAPDLLSVVRIWFRGMTMTYLPVYHEFGGWPVWMWFVAAGVGFASLTLWLLPAVDAFTKFTSCSLFALLCYFYFILIYPWYLPPIAILSLLALCSVRVGTSGKILIGARVILILLLGILETYTFVRGLEQMRVQQMLIEEGTRKQIGLWLRNRVKPGETIFLEPMGYIGYYSGARIRDYPGLVSPEVVKIRQNGRMGLVAVLPELKPDWAVLRIRDIRAAGKSSTIRSKYAVIQVFSIQRELETFKHTRGLPFLKYDSVFYILRKKPD